MKYLEENENPDLTKLRCGLEEKVEELVAEYAARIDGYLHEEEGPYEVMDDVAARLDSARDSGITMYLYQKGVR